MLIVQVSSHIQVMAKKRKWDYRSSRSHSMELLNETLPQASKIHDQPFISVDATAMIDSAARVRTTLQRSDFSMENMEEVAKKQTEESFMNLRSITAHLRIDKPLLTPQPSPLKSIRKRPLNVKSQCSLEPPLKKLAKASPVLAPTPPPPPPPPDIIPASLPLFDRPQFEDVMVSATVALKSIWMLFPSPANSITVPHTSLIQPFPESPVQFLALFETMAPNVDLDIT